MLPKTILLIFAAMLVCGAGQLNAQYQILEYSDATNPAAATTGLTVNLSDSSLPACSCSACSEQAFPEAAEAKSEGSDDCQKCGRRGPLSLPGKFARAIGDDNNDKACAGSHKGLHYWNDYSYLDDEDYDGKCLGDSLKRLGRTSKKDDSWVDIGGRFRLRYHHENGMARLTGSEFLDGSHTDHLLVQARLFADWHISKRLRVFAEAIYADAPASTLGYRPRGNERNRGDALNLFVDLMPTEDLTLRLGRQQLQYGSRRLIAGPGWANTSRSHDGIKLIRTFDNLRIDAFYMQRVPVLVDEFDKSDFDRAFWGIWSTYTGPDKNKVDLYYIGLDDDVAGAEKQLHTVGGRLYGGDKWLYDIEGAGQFGRQESLGVDHAAAFSTLGIGREFSNLPWKPKLWGYFDYATGNTPGGAFNRYDSLFNRRHHYLGFIDLVQRRNIEIPSVELTMKPSSRLSLMSRYFHIRANQLDDVIIPLGGGLVPQNNTSAEYGDTMDLAAKYKISSRSDARIGYSKFWRGDRVTANENASFVYAEWACWF